MRTFDNPDQSINKLCEISTDRCSRSFFSWLRKSVCFFFFWFLLYIIRPKLGVLLLANSSK